MTDMNKHSNNLKHACNLVEMYNFRMKGEYVRVILFLWGIMRG